MGAEVDKFTFAGRLKSDEGEHPDSLSV